MLVDLTTFASSAKTTQSVRCPKSITKKVGSVGTIIVGFIQVTAIVTAKAKLCVGKTELEGTLLVQVVDSGLARSVLVVIFLSEGMDSQMMRQRMPKQRPMLVSSHGFSKRYSHQGIRSILSNEFGNRLMESTAAYRSLRGSKGGKGFDSEEAGHQYQCIMKALYCCAWKNKLCLYDLLGHYIS